MMEPFLMIPASAAFNKREVDRFSVTGQEQPFSHRQIIDAKIALHPSCVPHRAHARVLDVHPNRV